MLTTGIWDEDNDDEFDDEEDDFGLGYFYVISELQVTRKAKWVHQHLNWFCSCQEART